MSCNTSAGNELYLWAEAAIFDVILTQTNRGSPSWPGSIQARCIERILGFRNNDGGKVNVCLLRYVGNDDERATKWGTPSAFRDFLDTTSRDFTTSLHNDNDYFLELSRGSIGTSSVTKDGYFQLLPGTGLDQQITRCFGLSWQVQRLGFLRCIPWPGLWYRRWWWFTKLI